MSSNSIKATLHKDNDYCTQSIYEPLPNKHDSNNEIQNNVGQPTGLVIDGTFDCPDSNQYLTEVSNGIEESQEYVLTKQDMKSDIFIGMEDPMVSGIREADFNVNFDEQGMSQIDLDESDQGVTFTGNELGILTPNEQEIAIENVHFIDECGNKLFFQQADLVEEILQVNIYTEGDSF